MQPMPRSGTLFDAIFTGAKQRFTGLGIYYESYPFGVKARLEAYPIKVQGVYIDDTARRRACHEELFIPLFRSEKNLNS